MTRRKLGLIYIDSGGGHRAAATALREVISQQQRPWDLEMVCIQDLLDPIDFIRKSTGIRFQDVYNIMLRRCWTVGTAQLIPMMHGLIRATHDPQVKVLEMYWRRHRPDVVVSLIPHYNRALKEALDRAWPGTPYVTLLTDIADYPPHFWIERMDQWVICGSQKAVEQAREIGLPESRVLLASWNDFESPILCAAGNRPLSGTGASWPEGGRPGGAGVVRRRRFHRDGADRPSAESRRERRAVDPDMWEERGSSSRTACHGATHSHAGGGIHARHPALHGTIRFLHR